MAAFREPQLIASAKAFNGWVNAGKLPPTQQQLVAVVLAMYQEKNPATKGLTIQESRHWEELYRRAANSPSNQSAQEDPGDLLFPSSSSAADQEIEALRLPSFRVGPASNGLLRSRRSRTMLAGAAAVVLVVAAVVISGRNDEQTTTASGGQPSRTSTVTVDKAPLTATVKTVIGGTCEELISTVPIDQLGAPPSRNDLSTWVRDHDLALGSQNRVIIGMTGVGIEPVMIVGLYIEIIDRVPGPLHGIKVNGQCGSPMKARYAEIDLDTTPPKIVKSSVDPQTYVGEYSTSPLTFPFKVSNTDPELLLITANSPQKATVSYRIHLDWTDGKTSGTLVIDDNGKPLRVATGEPGAPIYLASGAAFQKIN